MTYQNWSDPETARKWDEDNTSRNPLRPQQLEMLLAILEDEFEPGKTILDLGYGTGVVEQMIYERIPAAQIVGVDRSGALMALAAVRLKPYPFRFIPVHFDRAELSLIIVPASPLPRHMTRFTI